jgi:cell division septation protein DedD
MQAPVAAATLPEPKSDAALPVTFGTKSPEEAAEKTELSAQAAGELPPLPKATGGIWVVQLGSYAALDYLVEGWHGLLQKNKTLGDYTPLKSSIELEGETYYRLSVGTFATLDDADALCENLEAAGQKCFIRKGEGADGGDAKAA